MGVLLAAQLLIGFAQCAPTPLEAKPFRVNEHGIVIVGGCEHPGFRGMSTLSFDVDGRGYLYLSRIVCF